MTILIVEPPIAPSNFTTHNIDINAASYTWEDNSSDINQEKKFVIKDQNNTVIIDNISADITSITETSLVSDMQYQRKICASNRKGETCSESFTFKTQVENPDGKTTPFDFMGIVINVIETAQMFKVEFIIGGFKINFSIEKII
ncbi:MAG: fibronectin type III domain-containing protein [Candidatus Gracilibacteria bacterium]|nr:fibronectin type III domain-containing protein [Candidatus Gracilibacteria bacterium]